MGVLYNSNHNINMMIGPNINRAKIGRIVELVARSLLITSSLTFLKKALESTIKCSTLNPSSVAVVIAVIGEVIEFC